MEFLYQLFVISILSSLFTEALKQCLQLPAAKQLPNFVVGIIAIVITAAMGVIALITQQAVLCPQFALYLIILAAFAWASAMLGYDKVKQCILQIMSKKEGTADGSKDRISTDL